ncbi:MAG: SCO family protein [Thermoleophilaceae bacterium]
MNPRVTIALALGVLFAFTGLVVLAKPDQAAQSSGPERFEGAVLPRGLKAADFALTDQDGRRVTMRELRGKPVIVSFLYSTCQDTCPVQAQQIKGALNELGTAYPALAVSVDPPRDTRRNARAFNSKQRMTGRLTWALGTRKQLEPVWKAYAATGQRNDEEHNARFVLVDPKGIQRVGYPLDKVTPERVAHDVRLLAAGR